MVMAVIAKFSLPFVSVSGDAACQRAADCRAVRPLAMMVPFDGRAELRSMCQQGAAVPLSEGRRRQALAGAFFGSLPRRQTGLIGSGKRHLVSRRQGCLPSIAQAMEATEEALFEEPREEDYGISAFKEGLLPPTMPVQQPLPRPPKNRADDISLKNPLQRQERMGCGWLAVVFEWEGVIVEDDARLEKKAWAALAEEEGKAQPPAFVLNRAEGMKNEQAISEVLCWTRDFRNMKRLAKRKEQLYEEMQGGVYRVRPGSREFVQTLKKYGIPVAVASTRPRQYLERAIEAVGMEGFFDVVIAAEDAYRGKPDPEMFQYAVERLGFIPERCIVVGNSNTTVEAAHDALMKCVAVAGLHPGYELGAADLVVRRLDELSLVDLKNLSDLDSPEFQPQDLPLFEEELEEKPSASPKLAYKDDDDEGGMLW